ncbi:putative aspartyl aminopeptidase [Helianthus anomalus]
MIVYSLYFIFRNRASLLDIHVLVNSPASGSIVGDLLDYLNESWTQFHATAEAKRQLVAAGFHHLSENDDWELKPGGRYFFTRNMSCLIAFAIGEKYSVGNGFHVIAAHTDSPCLKLKPKSNYLMVNVQTVAGRVILRASDGSFQQKLVKVKRPLLRVPFILTGFTVNQDGFKPNLETHLNPLLATKHDDASPDSKDKSKSYHHPLLMQILSEELGCEADDIANIELNICDTQPSCLGGANNEFIFSGRLDNLASSFCALRALVDSCGPKDLSDEHAIRMVALFDNEEVGSDSMQGAGAPTMFQAMKRIIDSLANQYIRESIVECAIRQSFLGFTKNTIDQNCTRVSCANQRYATSGTTAFLFKEVGKIHSLPTQDFVVRNDMGCGSTIGPILASGIGIRTVDCGIPQLISMHSVREICGKEDIDIAYNHFKAFYQTFSSVDRKLNVD